MPETFNNLFKYTRKRKSRRCGKPLQMALQKGRRKQQMRKSTRKPRSSTKTLKPKGGLESGISQALHGLHVSSGLKAQPQQLTLTAAKPTIGAGEQFFVSRKMFPTPTDTLGPQPPYELSGLHPSAWVTAELIPNQEGPNCSAPTKNSGDRVWWKRNLLCNLQTLWGTMARI